MDPAHGLVSLFTFVGCVYTKINPKIKKHIKKGITWLHKLTSRGAQRVNRMARPFLALLLCPSEKLIIPFLVYEMSGKMSFNATIEEWLKTLELERDKTF